MATKFQVVGLKPLSGISKASNRPYVMLAVSGILTNEDGTIELGEVVFMERAGHPIPNNLQIGQTYTPTITGGARQGKIQFEITSLTPVAALKAAA